MKKYQLVAAALLMGVAAGAGAQTRDTPPAYRPSVDPSVEFPAPAHATRKNGVFVDPHNIVLVAPGMNKHQIYSLLDVPHFSEGLFGIHRWNYIINLYTGVRNEYASCQYQIRFDRSYRVEGTYWREQSCADLFARLIAPPAPVVVRAATPAPAPVAAVPTRSLAQSYALTFAFNSSEISPQGSRVIAQAAQAIAAGHYSEVIVTGATDSVGGTAYNDTLAMRRAERVAAALRGLVSLPVSTRTSRDLDVQTGPNVRDERNRRADIQIYQMASAN